MNNLVFQPPPSPFPSSLLHHLVPLLPCPPGGGEGRRPAEGDTEGAQGAGAADGLWGPGGDLSLGGGREGGGEWMRGLIFRSEWKGSKR